jgi:GNAT superfamily N-acetyltransferase
MKIRRAGAGDEATVRELRLRAIAEAPDEFFCDPETERTWSPGDWLAWIDRGAVFVLDLDEGPAGLAAGVPHWTEPGTAFLMSMWVQPAARGRGGADALVAAVLGWARGQGFTSVLLHVGRENQPAKRCYARNGFRSTGIEMSRGPGGRVEIEMRYEVGGLG